MARLTQTRRVILIIVISLVSIMLILREKAFSQGYTDPVHTTDWSMDGALIAVGYDSGIVNILDGSTGQILRTVDVVGDQEQARAVCDEWTRRAAKSS